MRTIILALPLLAACQSDSGIATGDKHSGLESSGFDFGGTEIVGDGIKSGSTQESPAIHPGFTDDLIGALVPSG